MKRIARIILIGVVLGLVALAITTFFDIDESTFWRFYMYFFIIVLAGCVVINHIYHIYYIKRMQKLAPLLEQGHAEEFVSEIAKLRDSVRSGYLKKLFAVNMSAGYFELERYNEGTQLLQETSTKGLPLIVKLVYNINLCVCYFFDGNTAKGAEIYLAHKKEFDRFENNPQYGGNIAVLRVFMAMQDQNPELARQILQEAMQKFRAPRLQKSFAHLEGMLDNQ